VVRRREPVVFGGAVVLALALALRLLHLWSLRASPFWDVLLGDARSYDAWAREIAAGDWIGHGVFYQAPLYAYTLAGIYSIRRSLLLVRVVQAVIGAGACALLSYAAARWFGRRAGLAAGLALASYAPAIFAGALIQKSVLDLFFVCLLLALVSSLAADAQRPWLWAAVGASLGALGLTRENAIVFVPVMLGWLWLGFRMPGAVRLRMTGLLVAGLAIVLLPVGLRNRIAGGEFHLTTAQSGPNFFIGNNPRADGTYVSLRPGRGSPEYERVDATALAERATGRRLTPGEVSRHWTGRAFDYIRAQPRDWLALEGWKFQLFWNAVEIIDTESQESHAEYSPVLRLAGRVAHFGVLAPLAALGIWITWHDRRRLWILYAMIAVYAASVLAFFVVARYRLPLAPLLLGFAGAALVDGFGFLRTRAPTHRLAAAIAVSAVAVFCNWPMISIEPMRAATYHNLGAALQEDGRLDEASAAYRRALDIDPRYSLSHDGLGSVLRNQGKLDEAIRHLEEAVRLDPVFIGARFNLANALTDHGDATQAIALYEEVLRRQSDAIDPGSNVDVYSNLGRALTAAGRLDDAIERFRRAALLEPASAMTHYNLGHALFTRGDVEEAAAQFALALQIEPANVSARYELGNLYLAQRQLEQAAIQFREAVRLSPSFADAHNNLGVALASLGQLGEAVDEFRAALRIDPSIVSAQTNLQLARRAAGAARVRKK
jgi:tetratricopeptide (TPR) repeat protein